MENSENKTFTNEQAEQAAIFMIVPRKDGVSYNEVHAKVIARWECDGKEEASILVYKNDKETPIGGCVFRDDLIIKLSDAYKENVILP